MSEVKVRKCPPGCQSPGHGHVYGLEVCRRCNNVNETDVWHQVEGDGFKICRECYAHWWSWNFCFGCKKQLDKPEFGKKATMCSNCDPDVIPEGKSMWMSTEPEWDKMKKEAIARIRQAKEANDAFPPHERDNDIEFMEMDAYVVDAETYPGWKAFSEQFTKNDNYRFIFDAQHRPEKLSWDHHGPPKSDN